jgi:hypothetical protein
MAALPGRVRTFRPGTGTMFPHPIGSRRCSTAPAALRRLFARRLSRTMSRANIRDVAARAGVAVKTVSRVLNGHPYVSADCARGWKKAMGARFPPQRRGAHPVGREVQPDRADLRQPQPLLHVPDPDRLLGLCQEKGIRLLAQPVDVADPMVGDQVRGLVSETHVDGIILSSPSPIATRCCGRWRRWTFPSCASRRAPTMR